MVALIIFFLVSIVFSFLCSVWEASLLSVTPSYIRQQVKAGTQTGKLLEQYKEDIDRPLSAILTLNTIAHTVGAIGVGAAAAEVFGDKDIPLPFGDFSISYESLVATLMTLAILILSEIIPKTIGANMWKRLAPFTVNSIRILLWILSPFVWLSQLITRSLKNEKDKSVLSRTDIVAMTIEGEETGVLRKNESKIINNLLNLNKVLVRDVMTPRTVIAMVNEETPLMEYYKANKTMRFSRIPVFSGKQDNVTGLVLKDDILQHLVEDEDDLKLSAIKREIQAVRSDMPLPKVFETLTSQRSHLAIVVDQYGSVVGLVTMEDVLETLLGLEIMDEFDAEKDLQTLARKNWEERARTIGLIE